VASAGVESRLGNSCADEAAEAANEKAFCDEEMGKTKAKKHIDVPYKRKDKANDCCWHYVRKLARGSMVSG